MQTHPLILLRVVAAAIIAPIFAWVLHTLIADTLALLGLGSADWRFLLTTFYGYVFLGFVAAGIAGKLVPHHGQMFVNLTIGGSVVAGVLLALASGYGVVAEVTVALAVVIGAVAYGLRLRGFSEPVRADGPERRL